MTQWLSKVVDGGSQDWEELVDGPEASPQVTWGRNGRTARRAFKIPQSRVQEFEDETFQVGQIPKAHPVATNLLVDTIELRPFTLGDYDPVTSNSSGCNTASDWLAVVTYTPWLANPDPAAPPPNVSAPVDILVANMSYTVEVMTLPGYALKWERNGNPIKSEVAQANIKIPVINWELAIPRARLIPWAAIRACVGCVNDGVFFGAQPETVLYNGPTISARFYNDGSKVFDINHSFSEKQIRVGTNLYGWNHIYDEVGDPGKVWDRPVDDDDNPLYTRSGAFPGLLI